MLLWKTVEVTDTERAFVYKRGVLHAVLSPGQYKLAKFNGKISVTHYDISGVEIVMGNARLLYEMHQDLLEPVMHTYQTQDHQVGLVYRNGLFHDLMAPGSFKAYWKGVEPVRVDFVDIAEAYRIADKDLGVLGRGVKIGLNRVASQSILYVEVPDEQVGLLKVNGTFVEQLPPGSYGFWKYNRQISVSLVDLRMQTVEVSGQEILTRDRVSLRLNMTAVYKILDPLTTSLKVKDIHSFIYNELQLTLREAVGGETLDAILADKSRLNEAMQAPLAPKLLKYGIELASVGVKDIILPGDMKTILNKVVEAQKEAEANLIKRREETQAMRSLHNTAKMMEGSPVLMRLKELEALERVTERVDKITVYGGLEGVLSNLLKS